LQRPRARSFSLHLSPLSPAWRKQLGAAFWSRAEGPSKRWHVHTLYCSIKLVRSPSGGARLLSVEVAPGENHDDVLRFAASLEQASHHVVAEVIVKAAIERGLSLMAPKEVRETMARAYTA